ncbi:MAG: PepSY-associated TM helix domain-containing protein [Duganella sp.]
MKAATLRTFRELHGWVGLVAGFGLFIAFYAGALSVFNDELHVWSSRSGLPQQMSPLSQAQPLVDALLREHPQAAQRFTLRLPTPQDPLMTVEWDQRHADGSETEHVYTLSPQGELVKPVSASGLADFVYHLHYTAGLPRAWGIYVLAAICVLYGLALVSGVILYTPAFFKDLFALRLGRNIKRMWQDAHNVIGILSLPFHVMYAWSSVLLALGMSVYLLPFQWLVYDGALQPLVRADLSMGAAPAASATVPAAAIPAPMVPLAQLYATVEREAPGLRVTALRFRDGGYRHGQVDAYGSLRQQSLSAVAAVSMNASTGEPLRVVTPHTASTGTSMLRGLYSLHFADFGGDAVRWMYFVLGMLGAFLFYSGNLLWIEARRKRNGLQTRGAIAMTRATIGVCLGSIAGLGAVFLANKLAPWHSVASWEAGSYYAVFIACVLWSCWRPPARAAHEILTLSAILCLLLPLAQCWRSGVAPWTALEQGASVALAVNVVALLGAWLYWRLARAVLRRGRDGDPASVWALLRPAAQPAEGRASLKLSK